MSEPKPDVSYDLLWQTKWGDMQHIGPVHRHTREAIVRRIRGLDVHSILDVGCGSGDNLAALAEAGGYQLMGVDISSEAVKIARARVPSARFAVLDIERSSLPDQFDLVMSNQVVEHIVDDIAAMRNMAKMARRYVFICTLAGRMRSSDILTGHVRSYSTVELLRKLEVVGLTPLSSHRWGFPFYSPLYRSAVELLPGGPPAGPTTRLEKSIANMMYHVHRLNLPGRGDVISALALVKS